MNEEELASATAEAEVLLVEESERRRPVTLQHQTSDGLAMTSADIASLKETYPVLAEFSDIFIRSSTRSELMKMQSTAYKLKENERTKEADDRLASNKSALAVKFSRITEGKDNRWTVLHSARFLGGAGCSSTKLWMVARENINQSGHPPIGNYDMGSVGMGGHVSARGWAEVHNPQSTKISIKMFSIGNCGSRAGTKSDGVKDSHADDTLDIGEFKLALRALRLAVHFSMPWNFSIEALEGFFLQSNFCQSDLANVDRKGLVLTQFTDYVLSQNCERWRDTEPFLTTGELKTTWASFFHSRPQSAIANKQKPKQADSRSAKPADPKRSLHICYAYNMGTCKKATGTCVTFRGAPLKHICDFTADKNKPLDICGKDHVRKDNH